MTVPRNSSGGRSNVEGDVAIMCRTPDTIRREIVNISESKKGITGKGCAMISRLSELIEKLDDELPALLDKASKKVDLSEIEVFLTVVEGKYNRQLNIRRKRVSG